MRRRPLRDSQAREGTPQLYEERCEIFLSHGQELEFNVGVGLTLQRPQGFSGECQDRP